MSLGYPEERSGVPAFDLLRTGITTDLAVEVFREPFLLRPLNRSFLGGLHSCMRQREWWPGCFHCFRPCARCTGGPRRGLSRRPICRAPGRSLALARTATTSKLERHPRRHQTSQRLLSGSIRNGHFHCIACGRLWRNVPDPACPIV